MAGSGSRFLVAVRNRYFFITCLFKKVAYKNCCTLLCLLQYVEAVGLPADLPFSLLHDGIGFGLAERRAEQAYIAVNYPDILRGNAKG